MREILFRGKRLDNGEWIEGFVYQISDDTAMFIMLKNKHAESYQVDFATVGQYTGLVDKNGKRIFEGDILCLTMPRPLEVKFTDGWFHMEGTAVPIKHAGKFRIIGNIHDNPKLLKEGEDDG